MNGRIVELYALTYSDRTGADNYNSLLLVFLTLRNVRQGFVVLVFVVSRIEIGRLRGKFRAAGINHLKGRTGVGGKFVSAQSLQFLIRIAQLLSPYVFLAGNCPARNRAFV